VAEVLEAIADVAGAKLEPEYRGTGSPPGEIDRQYVDSTKLRRLTGWEPEVGLHDGLGRALDWYRAHPEARP
jgi:nucleoside-diphosphate-sugar epimerase